MSSTTAGNGETAGTTAPVAAGDYTVEPLGSGNPKWTEEETADGWVKVTNDGGDTMGYSKNSGVSLIQVDGFAFKDLDRDGELDVYEDWRLDSATRDIAEAFVSGMQSTWAEDGSDLGWGNESVLCIMKHYAGAGASEGGRNDHMATGKYSVFPSNNFEAHLIAFHDGAFNLKRSSTGAAKNIQTTMNLDLFENPYCSIDHVKETCYTTEALAYGLETQLAANYFNVVTDTVGEPTGEANEAGQPTYTVDDIVRASASEVAGCDLVLVGMNSPHTDSTSITDDAGNTTWPTAASGPPSP